MERAQIKINGIVQGVGFRPFIHKLVKTYKLCGYIKNTSSGVELELEGEKEELRRFVRDVPDKAPKLALIESIESEFGLKPKGFEGFEIQTSKTEKERNTLISPDICVCDDCLNELRNPADRRYRYPFINCTNCGPRFTIIKDVPYDRIKTSMGMFPMCDDCDREYHDIEDRRYHAQPDACRVCGPHVFFKSRDIFLSEDAKAIEEARNRIKDGEIIAIKGIGGIHLACRLDRADELRKRKHRDEKPFAVMCADVNVARSICNVSDEEEQVLTGFRRPIVLLEKRDKSDCSLRQISENGYVGVMLPYTPLHYLLFENDIDMLVMTSANISDTPIMFDNDETYENLQGIADGFLLNNRDIQTRCDDSLCWIYEGKEYFARRSRGYVPFPIKLDYDMPKLLAVGAEQKASFCISKSDYVFPSQHIGDLKNLETYTNYVNQIEHFMHMFDVVPAAVACDMHPDYMSTEYAESLGIPVYKVQHHHAHMASCMADNRLEGEVIGLVWDGTGLGLDGTIWGSECLIGGYEKFERFATIKPIKLIGGDKATVELSRVAYVLTDRHDNDIYEMMLDSNINCPKSTGMGRLFDGVAAILKIKEVASYEGQGAVLLEAAARNDIEDIYPLAFNDNDFDWSEMAKELERETEASIGAAKFMNTVIAMGVKQCLAAREKSGINRVVLSGGSFQNMYIMNRLPKKLKEEGFDVYHHSRVSCNDEGISLGQICVLQSRLKLNQ